MENEINARVSGLIELLSSSDDLARTRACRSLIAMGEVAVPLLVEALEKPDDLGRWEAAKALGEIGDPTAAPALVQALEDDELEVRWRAAEGLTKMGVSGLRPLLQALAKDGDSVLLRDGAHHVLHNLARGDLRECLAPVLTALEGAWSSFEVPRAALRAEESLERCHRTRKEMNSTPFNGFTAMSSNQPGNLGARRRARRYAKSLQHRVV